MKAKRNRKNSAPPIDSEEASVDTGQSESAGEMPKTDTESPPPSEPAWKARVEASKAKESDTFTIVPETWLARQHPRCNTATRRELQRLGHSVERLHRLGVIQLADA